MHENDRIREAGELRETDESGRTAAERAIDEAREAVRRYREVESPVPEQEREDAERAIEEQEESAGGSPPGEGEGPHRPGSGLRHRPADHEDT